MHQVKKFVHLLNKPIKTLQMKNLRTFLGIMSTIIVLAALVTGILGYQNSSINALWMAVMLISLRHWLLIEQIESKVNEVIVTMRDQLVDRQTNLRAEGKELGMADQFNLDKCNEILKNFKS